jgi:hypothetical protein
MVEMAWMDLAAAVVAADRIITIHLGKAVKADAERLLFAIIVSGRE